MDSPLCKELRSKVDEMYAHFRDYQLTHQEQSLVSMLVCAGQVKELGYKVFVYKKGRGVGAISIKALALMEVVNAEDDSVPYRNPVGTGEPVVEVPSGAIDWTGEGLSNTRQEPRTPITPTPE